MEKNIEEKNQLQFLTCPECQGTGLKGKAECFTCQGWGLAGWTGQELLYWGKKIDNFRLAQEKIVEFLENGVKLSLIIFGVLGVLSLYWVIFDAVQTHLPFTEWLKVRNWQLLVFWLSLLSDCYLFYRFQREMEKFKHLPKKKFSEEAKIFMSLNWSGIGELPKGKKINVAEYFSQEARQAITKAWQLTAKYESALTKPIHLFLALFTFNQTQIIFSRLGAPMAGLKSKISHTLALQPMADDLPVVLSRQVKEIIFQAYFLAGKEKQKKVEITDLLEALISQENDVRELLFDLNITEDKLKNVIAWLRIKKQLRDNWQTFRQRAILKPKSGMNRSMTAIATPVLDAFCQDFTLLARAGYLFPCIGRQRELSQIFSILAGGARRSAILIGQPGVGKNTIIEGLAQMMVQENVPEFLQDKRLCSLSLAKLTGGAAPAEAQARLLAILSEIRRSGNIILFINDIHNMVGLTAGREGSIDLADVLAQALSSNAVLCLATTTPGDYRRYLENKSSLDNVFEKINVEEVSGNEAIQIIEAKAGTVEYKNQVFFSYDAIEQIVNLSGRYLHDRYLPEKAVQILQETATFVKDKKGRNGVVSAEDVALIVSQKTNIPLTKINQAESEVLLNLEERIHQRLIDQEEAVAMVASSLRRARAEMRDLKRPIVNLLFLGPTGVGKTELAKTVAEVYFQAEENMIRLDMSEYQEKSSLNRLIGAPPGYAGAGEGGYLAEAIRKNPFSLVLLDEIEKAHPDILNIFLQIMDDGRLTDNSGRTIDFTNAIIIATSNAGTKFIQEMVKQNVPVAEIKDQLAATQLNQYFRPEFLNRFDGIIVFKPLSLADVSQIAQLMVNKVAKNLEDKGISLEASPEALVFLAEAGFDPEFGARPLRRVIQEKIQDQLANLLLAGKIGRRDKILIQAGGKIEIIKAKEI